MCNQDSLSFLVYFVFEVFKTLMVVGKKLFVNLEVMNFKLMYLLPNVTKHKGSMDSAVTGTKMPLSTTTADLPLEVKHVGNTILPECRLQGKSLIWARFKPHN